MQETKQFPSSEILFELARDEYDKEIARLESLDNKSSFFITVIIGVATIFLPIIPFQKILNVYRDGQCPICCIMTFFILGIFTSFFLLIFAFINLYKAYQLTVYQRVSFDGIIDKSFHEMEPELLYRSLCNHFDTIVKDNTANNNLKCIHIKKGIKLCSIGFVILFVSTIGLLIIL